MRSSNASVWVTNNHNKKRDFCPAFYLCLYSIILIDYMLNRFGNIVKNMTVFPENMIRNMNSTFGLIFSQRAMLALIEKGMTREQAYDLVQPKTAQSWDNQVDFKPLLEADPEVTSRLTQEEIDEIFNPTYYTKRVDEIFERIGLGD